MSLWDNLAYGLSPDSVIRGLYVRDLLIVAMVMELVVAGLLVCSPSVVLKASALISLTSMFAAYRIGRLLYNVREPCNCFGALGKYFPFEGSESLLPWAILLFFLIGSYLVLLWSWGAFSTIKSYAYNNQM